ncbi:hypothetical protein GGI42DRAFT_311420 [Trichoderma sp. SZMC 28013]
MAGHDALLPPCLHLAVISGLLHLAVPVTRCCFCCRQSIGYAIKRPHHLRTMSRAISRTHQVFSAALGHASDALLTLFANQFNAQTAPVPGALWHPPARWDPAGYNDDDGGEAPEYFVVSFPVCFVVHLFASSCKAAAAAAAASPVARVQSLVCTLTSSNAWPPGIAKLGLRLSAGQVSCLASTRMYMYSLSTPAPGEPAPAKYLPLQALHASLSTALTSTWNTSSYMYMPPT